MVLSGLHSILVSVPLVLFAYSGLLKWLPFPIDPTLLFGGWVAFMLILDITRHEMRLEISTRFTFVLVSAFFIWYVLTAFYTQSPSFWTHKALCLVLNLLAFVVPVACMRNPRDFAYYRNTLITLAITVLIAVFYFYLTNMEFLLSQGSDKKTARIPDYLMLGVTIGIGTIMVFAEITPIRLCVSFFSLVGLALLGARGPALFTPVIMFIDYMLQNRRRKLRLPRAVIVIIILLLGFVTITRLTHTELLIVQRLSAGLTDKNEAERMLRLGEFRTAFHMIQESPFLGTGIGGYGIRGYKTDEDIYPHNLVLEVQAEAGIIGSLLFLGSLLTVLYRAPLCWTSRDGITFFSVLGFALINYLKSGGFTGARDLYMHMGVLTAFAAASLRSQSNLARSKVKRTGIIVPVTSIKERHGVRSVTL
jgi:O-antigen ligase